MNTAILSETHVAIASIPVLPRDDVDSAVVDPLHGITPPKGMRNNRVTQAGVTLEDDGVIRTTSIAVLRQPTGALFCSE